MVMDLRFLKLNRKKKEDNKYSDRTKVIKCKNCEMSFENKGRLKTHSRVAHTGRGERKKNDYGR
jgi:hypothetical protein